MITMMLLLVFLLVLPPRSDNCDPDFSGLLFLLAKLSGLISQSGIKENLRHGMGMDKISRDDVLMLHSVGRVTQAINTPVGVT